MTTGPSRRKACHVLAGAGEDVLREKGQDQQPQVGHTPRGPGAGRLWEEDREAEENRSNRSRFTCSQKLFPPQ